MIQLKWEEKHPSIPDIQVDIREFGAIEDGMTLNTDAIAAAIDGCSAQGGGTVVIPEGVWITGPIHLRSHIELHLVRGAELRFSQNPEQYLPVVWTQRGGMDCYNYSPLVYACRCHDIAITGEGVLNGQGDSWWPWKHAQPGMLALNRMNTERVPVEERVFGTVEHGVRPVFFQTLECRNVLVEGVTFKNSPSWTLHPVRCEDVVFRHVHVNNPTHAHNTDGIDIDGCRRVLVEHCHVDTGDDGICLKAGKNEDGWASERPCEDIVIRHNVVRNGHGGITLGSELSAGIRNVYVHNCLFSGTDRGIRMKSNSGRGGFIRNIVLDQIEMENIHHEAITISLHYNGEPTDIAASKTSNMTQVQDIIIQNVLCTKAESSIQLLGQASSPLLNIRLEHIWIKARTGPVYNHVEKLDIVQVTLDTDI